ncbi:uncharacterized protein PV07_03519 [Cladophialophora immunda]|uniref:Uncharacterized protein n=1 Tax=Cladophialophora immunda TaxID=569365 RepID=A0A0D2CL82_9EURO|nr:uncharacterized protein PV07_03519 [Cladophialophora immunda]KIW31933.1 hypothetical protein PV07_03519 [Cladophialophora immunda]
MNDSRGGETQSQASSCSLGEKLVLDAPRGQGGKFRRLGRLLVQPVDVSSSENPHPNVRVANVQAQRNDAEGIEQISRAELRPITRFAVRGLDVSGIGVATARWHKSTIPRILPVSNLHSGDLPGWKDLTHSCTSHKYADAWAQKT